MRTQIPIYRTAQGDGAPLDGKFLQLRVAVCELTYQGKPEGRISSITHKQTRVGIVVEIPDLGLGTQTEQDARQVPVAVVQRQRQGC